MKKLTLWFITFILLISILPIVNAAEKSVICKANDIKKTDSRVVDSEDFFVLADSFGKTQGETGFNPNADLNGDGVVDVTDYFMISDVLGMTCNNNAPVADPQSVIGNEDENRPITLTGSDADDEQSKLKFVITEQPEHGKLNGPSANRLVIYQPDMNFNGKDSFSFMINDGIADSNTAVVSITVNPVNDIPVITSTPVTTASEGSAYSYKVTATDTDGDVLKYSLYEKPSGMTIEPSGEIKWIPGSSQSGNDQKVVVHIDDGKVILAHTFTINVADVNVPPTLQPIGPKTVLEDTALEFSVSASDSDGDAIKYSAEGLPPGAKFYDYGKFEWTPTVLQAGKYENIKIRASDSKGGFDEEIISITVNNNNREPVFAPIGDKTINENQMLEIWLLATDQDSDDVLKYSLVSHNIVGWQPKFNSIGLFTWQPSFSQGGFGNELIDTHREYEVLFSVTDGHATKTQKIKIKVNNVNHPPQFTKIGSVDIFQQTEKVSFPVDENQEIKFAVSAKDNINENDPLIYSVENKPEGAEFDANTREFKWTPSYDQGGNLNVKAYNVKFVVTEKDRGNGIAPNSITYNVEIKVNDINQKPVIQPIKPIPSWQIDELKPVEFNVDYSDPDKEDTKDKLKLNLLTALPTGAVFQNNKFSWTPDKSQGNHGSKEYILSFEVTDRGNLKARQDVTIKVIDKNNPPSVKNVYPVGVSVYGNSARLKWEVSDQDKYDENLWKFDVYAYRDGAEPKQILRNWDLINWDAVNRIFSSEAIYSYTQLGWHNWYIVVRDTQGFETKGPVSRFLAEEQPPIITLTLPNNAPSANDDSVSTNEDVSVLIDVLTNDNDAEDGKPVIDAITANPAKGTAAIESGKIRYTPNANANGADTFTYRAKDSQGATDTAAVSVTINPVNDAPTANAQPVSTNEDTAKEITLAGSDVDGNVLKFSIVSNPAKGTLAGLNENTGKVTYSPNANFNGADSFAFRVNDGATDSTAATVSITVNPLNDAPSLPSVSSQSVNENTQLQFTIQAASDIDGDALGYSAALSPSGNLPAGASFDGNARTFAWTPGFTQAGTYNIRFTVSDNNGGSDFKDAQITVNNINRAPTITSTAATAASEGSAYSYDVDASDADGDALTFSLTANPAGMSINSNTGVISWMPSFTQAGSHNIAVQVSDNNGGTAAQNFAINVANVNGPPSLDAIGPKSVNENSLLQFTISAAEPDNELITYSISNKPSTANFDPSTRTFTWTPTFSEAGTYNNVRFTAADPNGASDFEDITIMVGNVNRAPTLSSGVNPSAGNRNTEFTYDVTYTDLDNDAPAFVKVYIDNTPFTMSSSNPSDTNYADGALFIYKTKVAAVGSHNFYFQASDGSATATSTTYSGPAVTNNAPVANNAAPSLNEDGSAAVTLTASDADSDAITFSIVSNPSSGALSGFNTATGAVTYTPNANFNGADSFTFKVNDGIADSNTATVSITVNPVNDPPIAIAQSVTTNEDAAKVINLAGSDADGNPLTFSIVSNPAKGTLGTITPTGANSASVTYTPSSNLNGADSFTFRVNDGAADSNTAAVSITINSLQDNPVLNAIGAKSVVEGNLLSFAISGSDADGDSLSFSAASALPSGASFSPAAKTFSWTPSFVQAGGYSITFQVSDGTTPVTEVVPITVTEAGNQAPILTAIGGKAVTEGQALTFTLSASDPEGSAVTFSASNIPAGASLNQNTGAFSWTPLFTQAGSVSVTFFANDANGAQDSEIVSIAVSDAGNQAPVMNAVGSKQVTEGALLTFTVSAADPDGTIVSNFFASNLPQGAAFAGDRFTWTPSFVQAGTYSVTFTASDGSLSSAPQAVSITVTEAGNQPPTITASDQVVNEGNTLVFTVSASDIDSASLSSITASNLPQGAAFANNEFRWTPGPTQGGVYDVSFRVDDGQLAVTRTIKITVSDVLLDNGERKDRPAAKFIDIGSIQIPGGQDFMVPGDLQMLRLELSNSANVPIDGIKVTASSDTFDLNLVKGPFTIKPGQRVVKYMDFELPQDMEPGEHYIKITIDHNKFHKTQYALINVV